MELVSKSPQAVNQVVKTMHPQGNSASLSQQSHMHQSLSNIHASPSAAHSYASQHPFSLTVSNQNLDQPPTSNHPVASSAVSQNYSVQKSNNQQSIAVQNSQTHTPTPVQTVAIVAPQVAESPEKSQANGTPEGEPSQKVDSQSESSVASKDKSPLHVPTLTQAMEVDPSSVQQNAAPVSAKTDSAELVVPSLNQEVSNAKATKQLPAPKAADVGPSSSSTATIQPDPEKHIALSVTASDKEQDPLYLPERDNSETPPKVNKSETKMEICKQEELKVTSDLHKSVKASTDTVKSTTSVDHSVKEERHVQKEVTVAKTASPVKIATRKIKTSSSREQERIPTASTSGLGATKRQRIRTQHYQSPLPEVEFVSKISSTSMKSAEEREKLIVFYKHEFLAVRNAEGGFYLCQAIQNIYKSSPKIKIRWLSQDKSADQGEVYTPDFYDLIDFDCILTNLSLNKADKGKFVLPPSEKTRTQSILNRSLAVEKGEEISSPSLTEEHPDGLDLSLYRDEDQLKKRKGRKRSRKASSARTATKKSPKAAKARKVAPPVKETVKNLAARKLTRPVNKNAAPVVPKPIVDAPKSSKVLVKVNSKSSTKTSPVVDQKKAKVLARIGRKTAATATKTAKNNSKNGKPGNKAAGPSNKTVQPKASSNGSVKTATRSVRKSARK